jgi:hypothetical protein
MFKLGSKKTMDEPIEDPTEWMLKNSVAEFVLMHTVEIQYMCMFGYTFLHGYKLFPKLGDAATSYKFVSFLLACTGGGILVPIFVNGIPVPLANDAYPIAIIISFAIHEWFPILRQVVSLSSILKVFFVVLYETLRASVVVKLTLAASAKIAPSLFSFPLFGPIFCGTLGGCGGAFLPFNKGLEPIKGGLLSPMLTANIGATCFHLYMNTALSADCIDAKSKAHLYLALFFIATGIIGVLDLSAKEEKAPKTKKE